MNKVLITKINHNLIRIVGSYTLPIENINYNIIDDIIEATININSCLKSNCCLDDNFNYHTSLLDSKIKHIDNDLSPYLMNDYWVIRKIII